MKRAVLFPGQGNQYAECLASCGTGPVCLVNDDFHEAVAPDQADKLLDTYRKKKS